MHKNSSKYPVEFVDGLFGKSPRLAETIGERKFVLIADQNLVHYQEGLGAKIGAYIQEHHLKMAASPVVLFGGERIKMDDFMSARRVIHAFSSARLEKDDYVLALGGGTVMDVAGWAASQWMGGVNLIRLPTTPVAMMSAAFADRAALDLPTVKDALSVPSVPSAVFIDVSLAPSVLEGVWRAGLSEAVRLAVAKNPRALGKIATRVESYVNHDMDTFSDLVHETVELRLKKGGSDLGLKTAETFEPKSYWKMPHGYAIPIATMLDLMRARDAGECSEKTFELVHGILKSIGALDGIRHSKHIVPPEMQEL